jgi:hypothetical protein
MVYIYNGNDQSRELLRIGCSVQMIRFVVNSPCRHGDPMHNDLPGLNEAKMLDQAACRGTRREEIRSYSISQFLIATNV